MMVNDKNIRILNINSYFFSSMVHQQLKERISKDYVYDTFIALEKNKTQRTPVIEDPSFMIDYCFHKYDRLNFKRKNEKIYKALLRSVGNKHYDVIYAHSLFTNGLVAYRYSKKTKTPYVVVIRSTDIKTFFKKAIHLRHLGVKVLLHAKRIIILTSKSLESIDRYIPLKHKETIKEKIVTIPNGLDQFWLDNAYQIKKKPQEVVNLLHVGDVSRSKNVMTTVKVLNRLNDISDVKFILNVVGKIENKRIYQIINNNKNVNYLGTFDKEDLIEIYRQNDIFVLPSLLETFGLVYAEAMSQGLPIIYTKNEGFDGQFEEGLVGYAIKPKSVEDIKKSILKILDNYESMSKNAIEYHKKFNWELVAENVLEILNDVGKRE